MFNPDFARAFNFKAKGGKTILLSWLSKIFVEFMN